jgi:hypothetical protein
LTPNISNQIRFQVGFVTRQPAETQQSQALFATAAFIDPPMCCIINDGRGATLDINPQGYPQVDVGRSQAYL